MHNTLTASKIKPNEGYPDRSVIQKRKVLNLYTGALRDCRILSNSIQIIGLDWLSRRFVEKIGKLATPPFIKAKDSLSKPLTGYSYKTFRLVGYNYLNKVVLLVFQGFKKGVKLFFSTETKRRSKKYFIAMEVSQQT